jgi:hypothetical protein
MRQFADVEDLSGLVRDALGAGCRVVAVDRLRGGSKKGVYRVRLDGTRTASVIDVEGLMYFDVEWEHVFLQIRFGERYTALARPGLDPRRLDLYMLAMRLSLVAGPLRLLDGDFPDRAFMQRIAEHNAKEALALLPRV